jgi:hypothetical protein
MTWPFATSNSLHRSGVLALSLWLLAGGCATMSTPYQPLTKGSKVSGGYSEQKIANDRYRVTFAGNSLSSRQQVENYLLLRAAQLTKQNGYDGFTMMNESTDPNAQTTVTREPFTGGPWGYWGPSWRYNYGNFGWRSWSPWSGDRFWGDDIDVNTTTRYEATAVIQMYRGTRAGSPENFDASQVITSLESVAAPG